LIDLQTPGKVMETPKHSGILVTRIPTSDSRKRKGVVFVDVVGEESSEGSIYTAPVWCC